jgi:hypothetical protein
METGQRRGRRTNNRSPLRENGAGHGRAGQRRLVRTSSRAKQLEQSGCSHTRCSGAAGGDCLDFVGVSRQGGLTPWEQRRRVKVADRSRTFVRRRCSDCLPAGADLSQIGMTGTGLGSQVAQGRPGRRCRSSCVAPGANSASPFRRFALRNVNRRWRSTRWHRWHQPADQGDRHFSARR